MYTHTHTETQEWLEFWKTWGRTSHGVINMKCLTLRLLDLGQILARWDSRGLKSSAHPNSLVLLQMLPETSGKSSFFLRIFFFFFRIQFQFRCELPGGPEHYRSLSLTHTFEWRNRKLLLDKGVRTCSTHILRETLPLMWKLKKQWL